MPLFYFHLRTSDGYEPDDIGIEYSSLEQAYLEAYRAIPGLTADFLRRGGAPLRATFVIADAAGTVLMEVPFAERLAKAQRPAGPGQHARARQLSREIADLIDAARETERQTRAILARGRAV